jgi:hypothetical protein
MKNLGLLAPFLICAALSLLLAIFGGFSRADELPTSIPAPVMNVMSNHCIICHDEVLKEFGSLDMSHWVSTPDGQWGFAQLDSNGKQIPSKETFRRIVARISTDDPDFHMPLGYTLTPAEHDPFQAWIDEMTKR